MPRDLVGVSERRRCVSMEGLLFVGEGLGEEVGRWDVELDDKPRMVGVITRVRVVGDRARIGLVPRGEIGE